MDFRGDERGQPVVIGALLVFVILVLAFSGYQAVVVPQQNADVEFQHSQDVQSQMQEVRSTLLRSAGVGTHQSTPVQLGTTYPSRLIALNPPPAAGTLRTTDPLNVTVRNATVDGETGDYWNGTNRTFTSRPVTYRPEYNVFDGAPSTHFEHSVLYNEFDDGTKIAKSSQQVVSGRQLNFVFVEGDFRRSGAESVAFDVAPTSISGNRVPLNASDQTVEIEIETTIPESIWVGELLNEQIDGADGTETSCKGVGTGNNVDEDRYVQDCEYDDSTAPATITLILENGTTYGLVSAKVGVGSNVNVTREEYITDIEGNASTIPEGGEQLLVAEVRDRFDNPVSGVDTCADVPPQSDGSVRVVSNTSNSDGRVLFVYEAPNVGSTRNFEVRIGYECGTDNQPDTSQDSTYVAFELTVNNLGGGGGGGGGSGGNPNN